MKLPAFLLCAVLAAPRPALAEQAERETVYDLLKLAPFGDRDDGLTVTNAEEAIVPSVGGFNTGFRLEPEGALGAYGRESELLVRLSGSRDYRLAAEVTSNVAGTLSVFLARRLAGRIALSSGRQRIALDLPAGLVRAGESYLTLSWQGARRLRGRLSRGRRILKRPPSEARSALVHRIELQPREPATERVFSVYVQVPRQGELVARAQGEGKVEVVLERDGAPAAVLLAGTAGEATLLRASLAAHAGALARLTLRAGASARWTEARIEAPLGAPAPGAALARPRNVVLWVIDTLRADKLRCYDPASRVRTPNFDAFARRGVLFKKAIAQSSHSKPAAATLLTGHYPASHGANEHKDKLRADIPLLSELFHKAGHLTAGFAANGFIGKPHGFARGWSTFRNLLREGKPGKIPYLFPHVERWLRASARKPFFLYVHSVDPHVPYNPPRQYLSLYHPGGYRGRLVPRLSGHQLDDARAGKLRVGPEDRIYARALYDGEVTVADHYFGKMLDLLEDLGIARQTLVVVTADHGEELWEHGNPGHGHTLYNELTRVPLLFGSAPLTPSGRVVEADVEMVDVAPTLLELAGLPVPAEMQGHSLRPLFERDPAVAAPAFSVHEGRIAAVQVGRWKYKIYRGGAERLFDLSTDPRELKDLAAAHPIARRTLRGLLSLWLTAQARWRKSRDGIPGQPR